MNLQDRYKWEAERKDGSVVKTGEDLSGCVRFSLIPRAEGLQPHALVGVKMQRRFCRGFIRGLGGGIKEYLHCVVCDGFRLYVHSTSGSALITPEKHEVYL